jgi:glycosyltransferase involved in cell wall biosynthesis
MSNLTMTSEEDQMPNTKTPILDVSAVLCVRNSAKLIPRAVSALTRQGLDPKNIIVVDGESSDQSFELASLLGCRVYSDQGKGFVAARNLGIDKVKTQFCLILGPDDELSPNSIPELKRELQSDEMIAAVACRKRVDPNLRGFYDLGMDFYYRNMPTGEVPVVGNPTLYSTHILRKVRYDPRFSANEDTDWCVSIAKSGYIVRRSAVALSFEFEALGSEEFRRRWVWYGEGDFVFVGKHLKSRPGVALRHLAHPATEYLIRLPVLALLEGNPRGIAFSLTCGVLRYTGLMRALVRQLLGSKTAGQGR